MAGISTLRKFGTLAPQAFRKTERRVLGRRFDAGRCRLKPMRYHISRFGGNDKEIRSA